MQSHARQGKLVIFTLLAILGLLAVPGSTGVASAATNRHVTYTPIPFDVSAAEEGTFTVATEASEAMPSGLTLSNDGRYMYMPAWSNDVIVQYRLAEPFVPSSMVEADTYLLPVFNPASLTEPAEPSGLSFNTDGTKFYFAAQRSNVIAEYHLTSAFDISTATFASSVTLSEPLNPRSLGNIQFNADGTTLHIADYKTDTGEIYEFTLATPWDISTLVWSGRSFATGIPLTYTFSFNHEGDVLFVSNLSEHTLSTYRLSSPWDLSSTTLDQKIDVDPTGTHMFGLALNPDGTSYFLLGTEDGVVREYNLTPARYRETTANAGEIDNSNPLTIQIAGDTFNDLDDNGRLDPETQVVIESVPAGLTPVFTLSEDDSAITVTFSGTATHHQDQRADIKDLRFSLLDAAFTGGDASSVTYSGVHQSFSSRVQINFLRNPGFTLSEDELTLDEDGASATFNVVLDIPPASPVTINLKSKDTNDATISPASLTFTPDNWDTPQTVTVTSVDDLIVAQRATLIVASVADDSSDDEFDDLADQNVAVKLVDNEKPAATIPTPNDPPAGDDPLPSADEPTQPADEPTPPADEPTQPAEEPTPPADGPTQPADEPTPPADDPTKPTNPNGSPTPHRDETERIPSTTTTLAYTGVNTTEFALIGAIFVLLGTILVKETNLRRLDTRV